MQRAGGGERRHPSTHHVDALALSRDTERRVVGEDDVGKQSIEENPLRLAPAARRRERSLRHCSRHRGTGQDCRRAASDLKCGLGVSDRFGSRFAYDRPHADEIEASKKCAGTKRIRATKLDEELHRRGNQFSELARELVRHGAPLEITAASQLAAAADRERVVELSESMREELGLSLGVEPRRFVHDRERRADHLADFVAGQQSGGLGESWYSVRLREHDIDRKSNADRC